MKRRTFLKAITTLLAAPMAVIGAKKINAKPDFTNAEIHEYIDEGANNISNYSGPLDSARFVQLLDKRLREVSEREFHF